MMEKYEITWIAGEHNHSTYAINKSFSIHSKHLILDNNLTLGNINWFLYELIEYLDI
jgi:hypothetical protein